MISDADLTKMVRDIVEALDVASMADVKRIIEPLRSVVTPGCYVTDKPSPPLTPRQTLEWYAGQILEIADAGAWFCVNSWLNCRDKFAPKADV